MRRLANTTVALLLVGAAIGLAGCQAQRELPEVYAAVETVAVPNDDDAADDPAIWVHPQDPALSRVLGTNKRSGLHIYDLEGRELQHLEVGRINNVDLRQDVPWGEETITLAAATNRTDQTLSLFEVDGDGETTFLDTSSVPTGMVEPYGLCLYQDRANGQLYVFANDKDGTFRQWRLARGAGRAVDAELVRSFKVASQPEGCVVDDARGVIYLGEEDFGIWRAAAAPDAAFEPVLVDAVTGPNLVADVEGMSLYRDGERTLLIVSSQGDNSFAVYDTNNGDRYLGAFRLGDGPIDGAYDTDGIDSSAAVVTPRFPRGLLVVQDGDNSPEFQNFKYVSMADALAAIEAGSSPAP